MGKKPPAKVWDVIDLNDMLQCNITGNGRAGVSTNTNLRRAFRYSSGSRIKSFFALFLASHGLIFRGSKPFAAA
jgi:hypothetical protein